MAASSRRAVCCRTVNEQSKGLVFTAAGRFFNKRSQAFQLAIDFVRAQQVQAAEQNCSFNHGVGSPIKATEGPALMSLDNNCLEPRPLL